MFLFQVSLTEIGAGKGGVAEIAGEACIMLRARVQGCMPLEVLMAGEAALTDVALERLEGGPSTDGNRVRCRHARSEERTSARGGRRGNVLSGGADWGEATRAASTLSPDAPAFPHPQSTTAPKPRQGGPLIPAMKPGVWWAMVDSKSSLGLVVGSRFRFRKHVPSYGGC